MKEDYLWNKKGDDAEIENLESILKEFRAKETSPPELPAKTFEFGKDAFQNEKPRRFSFQFAFAAFACVAFAITSYGVFQILNTGEQDLAQNNILEVSDNPKVEKPRIAESKPVVGELFKEETNRPEIEKAKFTPKAKVKQRIAKVQKQVRADIKRILNTAKGIEPKQSVEEPKVRTVKLTREEKEAFETLMQALAITGSQMRIVREKINGLEETQAVKEGGR